MNDAAIVGPTEIARTQDLIRPFIRKTPVIEIDGSEFGLSPFRAIFKLELLQHAGSFKTRGAFANLLLREVPQIGLVAASGGNHGAAIAYAAMRLSKRARIYVPSVASSAKIARIRAYGADLVVGGERYADALADSQRWAIETGALEIHAYDQAETLLGQGTLGAELDDQGATLDSLLVAVGGGGLIGGLAAWYAGRVRIIGVEPAAAPTLTRALEAGEPVDAEAGGIAADSLAPKRVGRLMFPFAKRYVERVILVSDGAIERAQAALWSTLRIVAEPGGAAAFAALLEGLYQPAAGERVGVLVCGGNTAINFGATQA